METVIFKLSELKNKLESVAFLVSKEGAAKEAHAELIQGLIIVSELESIYETPKDLSSPIVPTKRDSVEINKVSRRLKLWAKRPNQINSKILNAFLKLERSGVSVITENNLKNELSEEKSFESNFAQMKIIAEKNHGKVFDQYGENIVLWPPVVSNVREYEKVVFEKCHKNN